MLDHPRAPDNRLQLQVRWSLVIIAWLVTATLFAVQDGLRPLARGAMPVWPEILDEFVYVAGWIAATPLVVAWTRRFPLASAAPSRHWLAHLALATVLAPVIIAATYGSMRATLLGLGATPNDFVALRERLLPSVFILSVEPFWRYWVVVGIVHAFAYYQRYRDERETAARHAARTATLETQVRRAQLDALRAQLRPHFLFNTLNSIGTLIEEDPNRAHAALVRLADLLRASLDHDAAQTIPLREELALLETYVDIQRMRYQDRITFDVAVDRDVLHVPVPPFLLQPIVENAIRHGVEAREGPGRIAVGGLGANGSVRLVIEDDGPGMPDDASGGEGTGLANTRNRLYHLYGNGHAFAVERSPTGGCRITITLPLARAPTRTGEPASG